MSSLKICTAEYMISDTRGIGMSGGWLPQKVTEQFCESTKDGEIKLSPDPVTMIDGDLNYSNTSGDPQHLWVTVHRAPRSIVAQSPSTVIVTDAWTFAIGVNAAADFPTVIADTHGGRLQIDRSSVSPDNLLFGRYFLDGDDSHIYVDCGIVPPFQNLHFRYMAAVQTPGTWTEPTQFTPRWEANARWARLVALAQPAIGI
jgi:hypothetical protein